MTTVYEFFPNRNRTQPPTEPPEPPDMESRVASLEAIIPTLATKADLSELRQATKADLNELRLATKADFQEGLGSVRVEMHKGFAEQTRWIVGTALAGLAMFVTVMTFVLNNAVPKPPAAQAPQPTVIVVPAAVQPAASR